MVSVKRYVLSRQQMRTFVHVCDIWVTERHGSANGSMGTDLVTLRYAGVPCYYQITANVDDPIAGGGDIKRPTIITEDVVHLPGYFIDASGMQQLLNIPDGAYLVNRSHNPNRGQVHAGSGIPRILSGVSRNPVPTQQIMGMVDEDPPQPILDHYGNLPGDVDTF